MGIKHIFISLLIRVIFRGYSNESKSKWSLISVATSKYFLIWGFYKKNSFTISFNNFGCPIPFTKFDNNDISFRKSNYLGRL